MTIYLLLKGRVHAVFDIHTSWFDQQSILKAIPPKLFKALYKTKPQSHKDIMKMLYDEQLLS